jgi:Holliday junction resolvasome RuvABC endonuclease subunit
MIVLGLDPSMTGFGWCVHDSDATGPARVVARGRFATPAKQVFVARYMTLRDSIDGIIVQYPQIEAVGIESPPFGELWSEGLYALFVYVNEVVYTRRKDVVYFDPGTVKMLAKGDPKVRKGKMFKQDMVAAAKADTGIRGAFNHNEADAYLVAKFTARFWQLVKGQISGEDLTPSEHQAFVKIHTFTRGERAGETVRLGAVYKEGKRFYRFSLLESP